MSALGQQRTCRFEIATSALPTKADIQRRLSHVRFGPIADIETRGPILAHFLPQRDLIQLFSVPTGNDHYRH